MEALWQRLDLWLRAALPLASTLFMTLLGSGAWPIPYLGTVMPPLAFIALFYWSAHRPDLFSPSAAFGIGILNDLVGGGAMLGTSALLFTVAHQIIFQQRSVFAGRSFLMLWTGYCIAATVLMLLQWTMQGFLEWRFVPILPVLTQAVLGIVLFPLPCWILIRLQRFTASPS
ncbi:MAG: rod shape-determining protein MreD [Alphaproteobacteria bacterium]|nr:rod shape-determining protein MreD [Alphaproteobacteria bacterium]